jgi:hypothetical protein
MMRELIKTMMALTKTATSSSSSSPSQQQSYRILEISGFGCAVDSLVGYYAA